MRAPLATALLALVLASTAAAHEPPGERLRPFPVRMSSAAETLYEPVEQRFERSAEATSRPSLATVSELMRSGRYFQLDLVLSGKTLTRRQQAKLGTGPAGGRAVAHRAGGRPAALPPGRVPSGTYSSTGRGAGEPTLGVAPDGTLYYVGIKSAGDGLPISILQRSRDEGRTWEFIDLIAKGVADDTKTADPLIYVDPATGRLFNFDLTPPCSVIWHTDDRGDTFGQGIACNHTDHQTLFSGPPPEGGEQPSGYPNVVYYCAIDGGASIAAGITACSKSLDGGVTFSRTGSAPYVTDFSKTDGGSMGIPGFCYGATGHGRVGPDGTVYVPRGMCGTPTLAISRDEGDTWEQVEIGKELGMEIGGDLEEHEARVAIDSSLNVYYFWVARDHLPYLAVSRNGGRTFGTPMMVAPPGLKEAMLPAIAVGDDGRVAFSYLGTRNSPGGPFCVRTTTQGCVTADGSAERSHDDYAQTTWDGYLGMTLEATRRDPVFYTATVNDPSDPLHRGYCGGIACGATHEFHDVVIGRDGTPWASFVDGALSDPSVPSAGPGVGIGIAGRLVGGKPLVGSEAEQRPRVSLRRGCSRIVIRLREPRRGRLRSAVVTVDGKRVRVRRRGRRLTAVADLRGRRGTAVVVRIRARTTTGRTVRETRRYRTCAAAGGS